MAKKLDDIRQICKALPDTYEQFTDGHPTFFTAEGRDPLRPYVVCLYDDDRWAIWVAQPPGGLETYLKMNPKFFFRPPDPKKSDWVGIDLRSRVPSIAITAIITEGHAFVRG